MINHPNQYQPSYVPTEKGRIDIVQVQPSYAPNREDAILYRQFILTSNEPAINALQILEALIAHSKSKTLFVCCNTKQLEDACEFIKNATNLDVRFGTLGYNAQGLTIYK
jgi:hypothetical protein